jgi:hypothetical protein
MADQPRLDRADIKPSPMDRYAVGQGNFSKYVQVLKLTICR